MQRRKDLRCWPVDTKDVANSDCREVLDDVVNHSLLRWHTGYTTRGAFSSPHGKADSFRGEPRAAPRRVSCQSRG
ncbi:hypothetical protein I552_8743 [Mycobacterium xenopi 3993]|nr:hypothetical protein I552_8743 [Mycobacterium xenopi 3993]